jgi:hypothetical protein
MVVVVLVVVMALVALVAPVTTLPCLDLFESWPSGMTYPASPQSYPGEFQDVSNWCYLNLETDLGISFLYLSVNRHYSIRGIGSVWVRMKHLSLVNIEL